MVIYLQIKAINQFRYFTKSGVNITIGFIEFAFVKNSFAVIIKSKIELVIRWGFSRLFVSRNAAVRLGFVNTFSCIIIKEVYLNCSLLGM